MDLRVICLTWHSCILLFLSASEPLGQRLGQKGREPAGGWAAYLKISVMEDRSSASETCPSPSLSRIWKASAARRLDRKPSRSDCRMCFLQGSTLCGRGWAQDSQSIQSSVDGIGQIRTKRTKRGTRSRRRFVQPADQFPLEVLEYPVPAFLKSEPRRWWH